MSALLAFDRSVRHYDAEGRLHVAVSNISKANVCPYYGREIPDSERLGLDPNKIYHLYRDPKELERAAPTSNNIQLLVIHIPVSASEPRKEHIAGCTGETAVFNDPYLQNSLAIWDQEAIDMIEEDEQRELSCSYRYIADMTPGEHNGLRYDGIMRSIAFNHVALVREGRAGPDVLVEDEQIRGVSLMAIKSKKALMASAAIIATVRPLLATDARIDLTAAVDGVTATNFKAMKKTMVQRVEALTKGKLAADANLSGVSLALDAIEREDCGEDEMEDEDEDDAEDEVPDEETPEEKRERLDAAKDKAAKDKAAKDKAAKDKAAKDKAAKDAEKDDKDKEKAMDARIKLASDAAVTAALRERDALDEAKRLVAPHIGDVTGSTPSEIFKLALDEAGVSHEGVDSPAALKAMVGMLGRRDAPRAELAQDAANGADAFFKEFPDARRFAR